MLQPARKYEGTYFEFEIEGYSDSDFAKDESRRSITGYATFLEKAPVTMKSGMQKCISLSVTEAEFMALTRCVQDMLFIWNVLKSTRFKAKC